MKYFELSSEYLTEFRGMSPIDIYIYNETQDTRYFGVAKDYEFTDERFDEFKMMEDKGAKFQISVDDIDLFTETFGFKDEIMDLNNKVLKLEEIHRENLERKEMLEHYPFSEKLIYAVKKSNFKLMIDRARQEIECFSIIESTYQSNLIKIISKSMLQDNQIVRGAAFCYFFSKRFGITEEIELLELVIAYLLKDVGNSQVPIDDLTEINSTSEHISKHPMYSYYVLKKMPMELSQKAIRFILEHHERIDGSGYPRGKKDEHIDVNSNIIGMCDHLFAYSSGKVTGQAVDFYTVLGAISFSRSLNSLELGFFEDIKSTLASLVPEQSELDEFDEEENTNDLS